MNSRINLKGHYITSHMTSQLSIAFQRLRSALQRRGENRQLLPRPLGVAFVESFVHAGNYNRGVACVLARSIDRMTEPGTMRQSLRDQQGAFGPAQRGIQASRITRRISLLR